jgi:hypothetical protein
VVDENPIYYKLIFRFGKWEYRTFQWSHEEPEDVIDHEFHDKLRIKLICEVLNDNGMNRRDLDVLLEALYG